MRRSGVQIADGVKDKIQLVATKNDFGWPNNNKEELFSEHGQHKEY